MDEARLLIEGRLRKLDSSIRELRDEVDAIRQQLAQPPKPTEPKEVWERIREPVRIQRKSVTGSLEGSHYEAEVYHDSYIVDRLVAREETEGDCA